MCFSLVSGSIPERSAAFGEGNSSLPILLDDLLCTGDEDSLFDCIGSFTSNDCDHSEDAGVRCEGIFHIQYGANLFHVYHICSCLRGRQCEASVGRSC